MACLDFAYWIFATQEKSDPAVCDICGRTVSRGTDLALHRKTHLSPEERAAVGYQCPEPGCTFKSLQKSNFNTHRNTHPAR
ncbi:zinc-responsiveness transcriptional activator [Moniliophthora roreri MCA 2997]|uniref:Zinc-responsiveness transcriptional activator n=1 Tax=Moniliophthora roreri (strain MCA 2997) TaxID=1381753 RepID=V2XAV7_MONRO|nr:zinc-responsiveness transcriptional activator [Moniliophthora roreri MCA 2997]